MPNDELRSTNSELRAPIFQNEGSKLLYKLSLLKGFTLCRFQALEQKYGSVENILSKLKSGKLELGKNSEEMVANWRLELEKQDVEQLIPKMEQLGCQIVTYQDQIYPEALRQIYAAPLVLYARGNLELLGRKKIAVVGTRKCSAYGRQVTEQLVVDLTQAGLVIVSGLALGIDSIAHETALKAGGATIAVLGSAVDQIFPRTNCNLAYQLAKSPNGLLLSELPLGTKPEKYTFPLRNRIIAGLALGTLVTEAGEKSGALITASLALEQGRDVLAVPGPIHNLSSVGTNQLIRAGAKLVTSANEILSELSLGAHEQANLPLSFQDPLEEKIYNLLLLSSRPVDDLKRELGVEMGALNSILTLLELKGYVRQLGQQTYAAN